MVEALRSEAKFDSSVGPFKGHVFDHGLLVKIPIHVGITQCQVDLAKAIVNSGASLGVSLGVGPAQPVDLDNPNWSICQYSGLKPSF